VLEGALEQIWKRSTVLRPSELDARADAAVQARGGDVRFMCGGGGRLEEELGRLAVQMRGMDVEASILKSSLYSEFYVVNVLGH
jgi:hypothetical protein